MHEQNDYVKICEDCLKKYVSLGPDKFNSNHSKLMLECLIICKKNVNNESYGEMIGFMCASICADCLDPDISISDPDIVMKVEKIQDYLSRGELCSKNI